MSVSSLALRRGSWAVQIQFASILIVTMFRNLTCSLIVEHISEGQGSGDRKRMASRGELGNVRYLILFVFVQFLLLSNVCLCS